MATTKTKRADGGRALKMAHGAGVIVVRREATSTRPGRYLLRAPGSGRAKTVDARTDTEARAMGAAWAVECRSAVQLRKVNPGAARVADITVGDLLTEWLDILGRPGSDVRPQTLATYTARVRRYLRPALGAVRLVDLDTAAVNAVTGVWATDGAGRTRQGAGKALSPRTVRNLLLTMLSALQYAETVYPGAVSLDVIRKAWRPGITTKVEKIPTADLVAILTAARAKGGKVRTLVEILTATGCRRGEALGLRWQDVDLSAGTLTIRHSLTSSGLGEPKTSAGVRQLDIGADLVEYLRPLQGAATAYVVGYQPAGADKAWRALCTGLGVSYHVHQVRHSVATRLLQTLPATETARVLGHASPDITLKVYAHILDEVERPKVASLLTWETPAVA